MSRFNRCDITIATSFRGDHRVTKGSGGTSPYSDWVQRQQEILGALTDQPQSTREIARRLGRVGRQVSPIARALGLASKCGAVEEVLVGGQSRYKRKS